MQTNLYSLEKTFLGGVNEHGGQKPTVHRAWGNTFVRLDGSVAQHLATGHVQIYKKGPIDLRPIQARFGVGGHTCDCCGRTRTQAHLPWLLSCGRCSMAYYCSKECQRQQWQAGHKTACRKPGQIKPNDIMRLVGLQQKPDLNGYNKGIAAFSP